MTVGGVTTNYRYTDAGQRYYKKTGKGNAMYYALDGDRVMGTFTLDVAGVVTAWTWYIYGADRVGQQGKTGNPGYYPYGLEMPGRSYASSHAPTRENYTGHELNDETGLLYAGARYYGAALARWGSVDPMGPYASPYVYVGNDPVNLLVPTGLMGCEGKDGESAEDCSGGFTRPVDPDGNAPQPWPPEIHNNIIQAAFDGILTEKQIKNIQKSADSVDDPMNQGPKQSFMHAICAPKQSKEEAERLMNEFIVKYQFDFIAKEGDHALKALGIALHPIMDSTSPAHKGLQVRKGLLGYQKSIDAIKHNKREAIITPDDFNATIILV